ncbi:hypothetical protein GE09DRAFT_136897 [Coniochaeta sp. 2T2.1]|nr:hypothetical protein GE09DRAFT_136897 [Coniochaeta sp. 2T2.1]
MHLLPSSLWLLIAAQISAEPDAPLPTAVRKMPPDAGEKFYDHYQVFDLPSAQHTFPLPFVAARNSLSTNASVELDLRPAFAPLLSTPDEASAYSRWHLLRRVVAALERRDWSCPGGTNSCINIGYPNSCCPTGETCMVIQDTGLGPVGCCPTGSTCGGTISGCAPDNTPCGSEIGGGCCIPGYVCQGVGCVRSSTALVTAFPSTSAAPPPPTTTSTPTTTTTTTPVVIPPTTSTTSTPTTTPRTTTPTPTRTTDASAPVRPTGCPTGFYACLATAGGGCCQTGRDCQTTSCPPPPSSTTIVNDNGVTVVVPAGGDVPAATTTGSCATGWFLCGEEGGNRAGCCPSGYGCGTASCSLVTAGATASVAKGVPGRSGAGRLGAGAGMGAVVGIGLAVGVVAFTL